MASPTDQPTPLHLRDLEELRTEVGGAADRIAELGHWPAWMRGSAAESLTSRIPTADKTAPGFDAGVACGLDMIPRDKQALAAGLHGAYTPDLIAQVRREVHEMDPDSEAAWWLAACNVCKEDEPVDERMFREQLSTFERMGADPQERGTAANREYIHMTTSFETQKYGVPFGTRDGCMQGAYLAGYPFATMFAERYGIFFVGTPHDSLGLEGFQWKDPDAEGHRGNSGPVFGSKQFVKCADEEEFKKVLEAVKAKFPEQPEAPAA